MTVRKTILILSLAAAGVPAAYANSGATFVGGELGYQIHAAAGGTTRAQVTQELQLFRAHPVASDGTVMIRGELGYVPAIQGEFADRVPNAPHTHMMGNKAAVTVDSAGPAPTELERRALREQYIN